MLAIEVNGSYLDLGAVNVTFELVNPIFDAENIRRIYSFPFNLELTDKNKRIFSHIERLDTCVEGNYTAKICLSGQEWIVGVLKVGNTSNCFVKCYFQSQEIEALDILDTKLREADLGSKVIPLPQFSNPVTISVAYLFPSPTLSYEIAIRINGEYFIFEKPATTPIPVFMQDIVNELNASGLPFTATWGAAGVNFFISFNRFAQEPLCINFFPDEDNDALLRPANTNPLTNNEGEVKSQDIAQWFENNYLFAYNVNTSEFAIPLVYNAEFYNTQVEAWENVLNNGRSGIIKPNKKSKTRLKWFNTITPMLRVLYIFQQMGLNLSGDIFNLPDIQNLIIYNNKSIDEICEERYDSAFSPEETHFTNCWRNTFDLNEFVPDITLKELYECFRFIFNQYTIYENGSIVFKSTQEALCSDVEDWTSKAEEAYTNSKSLKTVKLGWIKDSEESLIYPQLEKYQSGEDIDLCIDADSLYEDTYRRTINNNPYIQDIIMPHTSQEGYSTPANIKGDLYKRFLFYRGMQNDSLGLPYAYATHTDNFGECSLDWNAPNGLIDKWWSKHLKLIEKNQNISIPLRLDINDLKSIQKWDAPRKLICHPKGQVIGVVKKIRFQANKSCIGMSKVEFAIE